MDRSPVLVDAGVPLNQVGAVVAQTADPALRRHPARLIGGLNQRVKAALQQSAEEDGDADEGMDAAFVRIPHRRSEARAASAKLPIIRDRPGRRGAAGVRRGPEGRFLLDRLEIVEIA